MPTRFPPRRVSRRRPLALPAALVAGLLAVALPAAAEAARGDAEALVARAMENARRGDYEAAIVAFRAALAEDPGYDAARFQLARVLAFLGRFPEAHLEFSTLVAAHPDDAEARRGEVTALLVMNRYADAKARLEDSLRALPRDGWLAHLLARLLATAPDASVRDGRTALALARTVYEAHKSWKTGETIALAHAEAGELDRAFSVQAVLITQARERGDEKAVAELEKKAVAFHQGKPWRAKDGREIVFGLDPPAGPGSSP